MSTEKLVGLIKAGYPFIYTETSEPGRFIPVIREAIEGLGFNAPIIEWDCEISEIGELFEDAGDADDPLLGNQASSSFSIDGAAPWSTILLKNFGWFLEEQGQINKKVVQWFQNRYEKFASSANRRILIVIGDEAMNTAIPSQLQRMFASVELGLPTPEEIQARVDKIIEGVKSKPNFVMPGEDDMENIVASLKGLTDVEVGNAVALSLITTGGKIDSKFLARQRAEAFKSIDGLKVFDPEIAENADEPKGYSNLTNFVERAINSPLGKGVMLLGPPGTGKTLFAETMGRKSNRPMFELEIAQTMGEGLVGQAEKAMKKALDAIKANAPCILFVDEIEKGLAGVGGSSNDGGTTKRSMGQFLKFMSNRPDGIYIIATCNDIQALPPEWVRAERWDTAPFFVDLPGSDARQAILEYYALKLEVDLGDLNGDDLQGWAGAEIKSLCRISTMMNTPADQCLEWVVPVSETMGDRIKALRQWAKGKTIPAEAFKAPKAESNDRAILD